MAIGISRLLKHAWVVLPLYVLTDQQEGAVLRIEPVD